MRAAVLLVAVAASHAAADPDRIHTYRRAPKLTIHVTISPWVQAPPPVTPETRDPSISEPAYHDAWDHLDQGRHAQALESFFRLTTNPDPRIAGAARRGFVIAYADIGKADRALAVFKRIDAAGALGLLEHLAQVYVAQGKADRAIYVHQEMMRSAPSDPRVCEWQTTIARMMLIAPGARQDDKVKEVENLVKLYGALDARKLATVACHDAAAAMSGDLARAFHNESVRAYSLDTIRLAGRLYRAYLGAFPTARDYPEMAYLSAEAQWSIAETERGRAPRISAWEDAAAAFEAVTAAKKATPAQLQESALAAILAWKNALDLDPDPASYATKVDFAKATAAPAPVPPREDRLWKARRVYEDLVRNSADEEVGTTTFLEAALRWRHARYAEVIDLLVPFVKTHRKHKAAEAAARLLLDSCAKLERTKELTVHADRFAADADFLKGKPALAADLAARKRRP